MPPPLLLDIETEPRLQLAGHGHPRPVADPEGEKLGRRGQGGSEPDADEAGRPARQTVARGQSRPGQPHTRDLRGERRVASLAQAAPQREGPVGQRRARPLDPAPSVSEWAHVRRRAVDEEGGRARLPLETRRRLGHQVAREEEIVAPEGRPVHGIAPHDGDGTTARGGDLEHSELGVERLLQSAPAQARQRREARDRARGLATSLRLSGRRLHSVEEPGPHLGRQAIEGQETEERRLAVRARARMRVRGRQHKGGSGASRGQALAQVRDESRIDADGVHGEPQDLRGPGRQDEGARPNGIVHAGRRPEPEGVGPASEKIGHPRATRKSSVARERRAGGKHDLHRRRARFERRRG